MHNWKPLQQKVEWRVKEENCSSCNTNLYVIRNHYKSDMFQLIIISVTKGWIVAWEFDLVQSSESLFTHELLYLFIYNTIVKTYVLIQYFSEKDCTE